MPFIPHTPEALRPASEGNTCNGITLDGKPCKRALSRQASPTSSPRRGSADGFCWQHKDQVQIAKPAHHSKLKERTSIDTLAERLGFLEIEHKRRRKPVPKQDSPAPRPARKPQPRSGIGLFCCIGEADEGRRAPRPTTKPPPRRTTAAVPKPTQKNRPPMVRDPPSRTGEFLAFIPPSTAPETTAQLLAEMAKPVSEHDDEGYIYMFWLTPETQASAPPRDAARALLSPPTRGQRRPSEVIDAFAMQNSSKKTILLKIGRASNVQRRLNQWTRQCGYDLSLIRYYPYQPTTLSSTSINELPKTPRKVANVHKVERLIHIELHGKRAVGHGKCEACGKEHREWFEVEGSRHGVKAVDEVVRRWVEWGETTAVS